jgi:hypothetical protein
MGTRTFSLSFVTGLSSGSFVLPVDYDASGSLTILCIGGGGGGEKRANSSGGGGGGGGGGLAHGSFSGLQPGRTIYFSLGSGGAGGTTNGGQSGGNGTDSWVNINSNAVPTSTSEGVRAIGGSGGSATSGGSGGFSGSVGSLGTASGGNGGLGSSGNGSGGGGGGAAGRYTYSANTYGTGGNGGNGRAVFGGDGGGGGGGGVLGAGSSSFSITGATGGLGYDSASGGGAGLNATNPGGGGGGGTGINSSSFAGSGGISAPNITETTGELISNYGYSSGGGGGGGGSNNSGSTGGNGGNGFGTDSSGTNGAPGFGVLRSYGGGGGGGGSGVSASGNGGNGGSGVIIVTYTSKENMLPTTNLSFTNIQSYFGGSNPISLTEYYRNTGVVSAYARNNSNTLIPTSGQISVNNFRGAPFKLYRQIDAGSLIVPSKFFTSVNSGYDSVSSIGSINSTAFTLSGGSSVSISAITKANLGNFVFRVNSASAVSNSGWDYLIIDETTSTSVYSRADAIFESGTTVSTWTWTTTNFTSIFDLGSDFVVKFV